MERIRFGMVMGGESDKDIEEYVSRFYDTYGNPPPSRVKTDKHVVDVFRGACTMEESQMILQRYRDGTMNEEFLLF
jgi:hypothetical protein